MCRDCQNSVFLNTLTVPVTSQCFAHDIAVGFGAVAALEALTGCQLVLCCYQHHPILLLLSVCTMSLAAFTLQPY